MAFKPMVNYHSSPVPIPGEAILIDANGVALLSETPDDPAVSAVTVSVDGTTYTRVTGSPVSGSNTYRIKTQAVVYSDGVVHVEYLPLLEFHIERAGLLGTCSYSGTGTTLTTEWYGNLIEFTRPIVDISELNELPAPTMDRTQRGSPGDFAFMTNGAIYFSDGTQWIAAAGGAGTKLARYETITAGAVAVASRTQTISADVSVAELLAKTTTIEAGAAVFEANQKSQDVTADAAVLSAQAQTVESDAAVKVALTQTVDANAIAIAQLTQTVTADSAVQGARTQTVESDSVVADQTAPSVGTLTVPDTTGTSITGISIGATTDAVGVVKWMIKEAATDSFTAPVTGDSGWTSVSSTTSFSSSALTFTSTASATATRYFRLYACDAAGNVGASATDSATITISAGGIEMVGTPTGTQRSSSGTLTATLPTGIQSGDLIVLICTATVSECPSGYGSSAFGQTGAIQAWTKVAGSSESNPTTGTLGVAGSALLCFVVRGQNATISDATAQYDSPVLPGSTRTVAAKTITTATNGAFVVAAALIGDGGWDDGESTGENTSLTVAAISGFASTEIVSGAWHVGVYRSTLQAGYAVKATAGATGTTTFSSTLGEAWPGYTVAGSSSILTIAIRPA